MVSGRRAVALADDAAWVFNRMADVYDARPAYPEALIDALAQLPATHTHERARVLDVGAGIGHLALPLASRGFAVTAIDPARAMLERLQTRAQAACVALHTRHASAEALPFAAATFELALIADALHFIDAELVAHELARVLTSRAALAIVTSELADTPFMRGLSALMQASAPRRPRELGNTITQVAALCQVQLAPAMRFHDAVPVDEPTLERILRSISFIGPAMNPERFARFWQAVRALPEPHVWARELTLHAGRRR